MSKLTSRISLSVILAATFTITAFIAMNYESLGTSFYLILSLLTFFVFFFGVATGQSITSPVKKLLERATELSKGNLSSRVYLETKDELSELAKVFNMIAEELETTKLQTQETERSVELKVRAQTQDLKTTIDALEQKVRNRTAELDKIMSESQRLKLELKNKEAEIQKLRQELNNVKQRPSHEKHNKPQGPELAKID